MGSFLELDESKQFLVNDINEIIQSLPENISKALEGKTILITGGCGFLGKYFCEVFGKIGTLSVICVDNYISSKERESKHKNIQIIKHDVTQPFSYPYDSVISKNKIDFILHAAGIASPAYYRKYPLETLKVATDGLQNSLNFAKAHNAKLLFFSSSEIYGDPDPKHVPTQESYRGNVSCLGPRACYDESKRLGETLVRIYQQQYGVHATIVRPFNVYGPGMQKTDYRVLPNFAASIAEGKDLHIYGSGTQTRTFCYVTDAIRGFLQVLIDGIPGEPYNIGNPKPEISMMELAQKVSVITSATVKFDKVDYPDTYPPDEPMRRCPDISKASTQLGYFPTVPLDSGLLRFFLWAKEAYKS